MGLDIYRLKVRHPDDVSSIHPHRLHKLMVSNDDLKENKSLSDVLKKFQLFVTKSQTEYYNIKDTAIKHDIPVSWYYAGLSMLGEKGNVMVFSDENDVHKREIPLEDVVVVIDDCYTLYSEEVGYQRKDCTGPMFDEFFGGGEEYFGIHYTPYNEVLDVAKTYTNPGSSMESWVLLDDEFICFSF